VSSAFSPHQKSRKVKRTGRHCAAPTRARRSVRILAIAVPALTLAGVFAAYEAQPQQPDPVASSVAAYNMNALALGGGSADVIGKSTLVHPAKGSTSAAATTRAKAAHPGSASTSRHAAQKSSPLRSAATTLACPTTGAAGGTGMLPLNYAAIVNYLVAHHYTKMAAVGIAGNIYQESKGDPESVGSGGGGLIGWTPLPSGFVTGNAAADLQTQLAALLTYNQGWAQYVPMLNAATNPTDAAYIYMTYFERPGLPAASNREGAAVAVAQACGIS
jgi:Phage tail lysozyme